MLNTRGNTPYGLATSAYPNEIVAYNHYYKICFNSYGVSIPPQLLAFSLSLVQPYDVEYDFGVTMKVMIIIIFSYVYKLR